MNTMYQPGQEKRISRSEYHADRDDFNRPIPHYREDRLGDPVPAPRPSRDAWPDLGPRR